MEKSNQKEIKLLIYTTIGMIMTGAISIMYYFVIALPQENDRKISIQEQEFQMKKDAEDRKIAEEEKKKQEETDKKNQALLDEYNNGIAKENCLQNAYDTYSSSWNTFCGIWKKETTQSWDNCIKNSYPYLSGEDKKNYCKTSTLSYNVDSNGVCLLPSKYSTNIEDRLKVAKQECNQK